MLENLAELYQELIIEHSKNPRNTGIIDTASAKRGLGVNPSCGDKLLLSIDMENGVISSIKHDSDGCSIFRSSCSMMSQILIGKTKDQALEFLDIFIKLIIFQENNELTDKELELLGKLKVFHNIRNYPARVKCALLFTRTMQELLKNEDSNEEIIISTED